MEFSPYKFIFLIIGLKVTHGNNIAIGSLQCAYTVISSKS
jgi:hypothetical protein